MMRAILLATVVCAALFGAVRAGVFVPQPTEDAAAGDTADSVHDAELQADIEARYLREVRRFCGPDAIAMQMEGNRLQCYTPRGRAGAILITGGSV